MPGKSDRDESIERLLRSALRSQSPEPSPACVDAETLAAWSEQALPASQAARVEAHLSTCTRCQNVAALFARTAQVPATVPSVWRRWSMRWLVPLTVGAAATIVWSVWPRERAAEPAVRQIAQAQPAPATGRSAGAPSDAAPSAVSPSATGAPPAISPSAAAPVSRSAPAAPALPSRSAAKTAAGAAAQTQAAMSDESQLPAASPSPQEPPPSVRPVPPSQPATSDAADRPVAPAPAPPPARRTSEPTSSPAVIRDPAARMSGLAVAAERFNTVEILQSPVLADQTTMIVPAGRAGSIRSTRPLTRWRVLPSGLVQWSTSDGASWEPTSLTSLSPIRAGSAPSPSTCWLVGSGGVVYLTTDGRQFHLVPFPEKTDLVAVRAVNAAQATVTTADGHIFSTEDGGATWK